ncbi:macrophage mannose receptor 1-like protein 1-like protein [Aphelenchoides avenae]|nr:macrophage mannose receptor 1-like protein 1-like protein [Aphelenchus avenae]
MSACPVVFLLGLLTHSVDGLGTEPSKLEVKCNAYPSLSHYHNGVCYIVDPGRKASRNSLGDSTCSQLNQYNGIVAEHRDEVVRILERHGLLRKGTQAIFKDRVYEDGKKDESDVVCAYHDDFYCPSGYELNGLHCFKVSTKAASYSEAKAACAQEKGTLAVVHDDRTVQLLATLANKAGVSNEEGLNLFYIGLSASKQGVFENADATQVDYFRWLPKENSVITNDKLADLDKCEEPAVAISSSTTDNRGLGTFGYMDLRDGKSVRLPFACQVKANHHWGPVTIPYSSL